MVNLELSVQMPLALSLFGRDTPMLRIEGLILRLANRVGLVGTWALFGAAPPAAATAREGGREGGPHFFRVIERTQKERWRSR